MGRANVNQLTPLLRVEPKLGIMFFVSFCTHTFPTRFVLRTRYLANRVASLNHMDIKGYLPPLSVCAILLSSSIVVVARLCTEPPLIHSTIALITIH